MENIKIATPWPVKKESQPRIEDSLRLWNHPSNALVCLVEPCENDVLKNFETEVLPRNSQIIGANTPKLFILDMIQSVVKKFPNQDWYGFCNSDCVPIDNLTEGNEDCESLIFHRTEIDDWFYLQYKGQIEFLKSEKKSPREIARTLNLQGVVPPRGDMWLHNMISIGRTYFWGQDMYLFRKDVVNRIINDYLEPKDPIIGTAGFDPRLSRWCTENTKSRRVIHKLYHKKHQSEWRCNEIDHLHNGGSVHLSQWKHYYDSEFIETLIDSEQTHVIPKHLKFSFKQRPELKEKLSPK